jgi:hypothetical protein
MQEDLLEVSYQPRVCENSEFQAKNNDVLKDELLDRAITHDREVGKGQVTLADVVNMSFRTASAHWSLPVISGPNVKTVGQQWSET